MQRKFLSNLVLLLFLNLVIKPYWIFGVDLQIQNLVGTEEYGFYFNILNFSFLFNIVLDLGITNFNNRNIAQNSHLLHKHFSNIFLVKLLLLLAYFVVTLSTGLLIGYSASQMQLLILVGVNQFLLSFILYLRSNISGLLMFRTDSVLSVLDRVFMILLLSFLIWYPPTRRVMKIEWFVYAQTLAYTLTALIGLAVVIRKSAFRRLIWSWPFTLMIIRKSFPFAILVLLMTFYNRVDSVFIERLLPNGIGQMQVGIYASAFRILDAVNMMAYLFSVLLLPLFASMLKNNQNIVALLRLSFTLVFTLSVGVALISFGYRYEIMSALYPMHSHETLPMFTARIGQASDLFGLLMFGFLPISSSYVIGTLLTANGNLRYLNLTAAFSMMVSVILNLWLVPELFAYGSAIASVSSQFLSAIVQVFLVVMLFRVRVQKAFVFRLLGYVIGSVFLVVVFRLFEAPWMAMLIATAGSMVFLAFSLKLLEFKALIKLLRP